jgi:hypothetical protein
MIGSPAVNTSCRCRIVFALSIMVGLAGCGTTSGGTPTRSSRDGTNLPACPTSAVGFPLRERQPGVTGCPADIRTQPGSYPGYEVVFGCLDRGNADSAVVLLGTGKKSFRQLMGPAPAEDEDDEKPWRRFADNARQTAAVKSVDRSGRVHACRSAGYAVELRMHDYREVDDAIEALGDWLAKMDVRGEVMLTIAQP